MHPSQQQSGLLDRNSLIFKSVVAALQVVLKHQDDQQKRANCQNVLQKFVETPITSCLRQLYRDNYIRLVQIRTMFKLYRNAFQKITQKEDYKQFKIPDGRISEILLGFQQKIDPKDFKISYLRAITLRKKKFNWSKEFIQDWMMAFEQERRKEEQIKRQKQSQRNNSIISQQLTQLIPPQNQSFESEKSSKKIQNKISHHQMPQQVIPKDMHSTNQTNLLKQMEKIYQCPITLEIMNEPLMMKCGHTFEKQSIHLHLVKNKKQICPLCRSKIKLAQGMQNLLVKQAIENLKKQLLVEEMNHKMGVFVQYQGLKIRYVDKKATLKDFMQELSYMTGATKIGILINHFSITCNGKALDYIYSKESSLMLNLFLSNNSTVNVERRTLLKQREIP